MRHVAHALVPFFGHAIEAIPPFVFPEIIFKWAFPRREPRVWMTRRSWMPLVVAGHQSRRTRGLDGQRCL